ncbi:MAG: hypothetical protein J6D06_05015 [Clostridia bacterium]|nr:hypothetical protein [Clostridia bacterium]
MFWEIFLVSSVLCLSASLFLTLFKKKLNIGFLLKLDNVNILICGVALASVIAFIPVYYNAFVTTDCNFFETLFISVHNTIRLFVVDGDYDFIIGNIKDLSYYTFKAYSVYFAILYVLAPVFTFSFALSFFKNLSAYRKYFTHFYSDAYIFSELNERSLALAESLMMKKDSKRIIAFTDVFDHNEEKTYEMLERAKNIGAVLFKKDIISVDFSRHHKKSKLTFFIIGEDHNENLSQSLSIIEKFKYRSNTNLNLFTYRVEDELLLAGCYETKDGESDQNIKIKIRNINDAQSLVLRTLFDNGYENVFKSAIDNGENKKINAVVVGMGRHGIEMTKALSWFCQMDGYVAEINAFDLNNDAEDVFCSMCPELMAPGFNGNFSDPGEAQYKISVHSGINVETKTFDDKIISLDTPTYIFVCLGDDAINIATAIKLRTLFARYRKFPVIQAVVYNSDKRNALVGVKNFKKQKYDIDFIGDLKESYSEEVVLNSDIIQLALQRHLRWGDEEDFWRYSYNYKSSVASAIHRKLKIQCKIPGADIPDPAKRSDEDRHALRVLEHRRWNAYMRSEGYVFGGTIEPAGRFDLAKQHNCLVTFDDLPESEKIKDDD